jgi:hypothetical protein
MCASPSLYTTSVNQHKSSLSFQCPPYWGCCILFPWEMLGPAETIQHEMQRESADFPGASSYKTKDCKIVQVVVRVQLGHDVNKQINNSNGFVITEHAQYACMICKICKNKIGSNLQNNMQKICKKKICTTYKICNKYVKRCTEKYAIKYVL